MSAIVIDGKKIAQRLVDGITERSVAITNGLGRKPCLAVILVGDNPASQVYVKSKSKRAESCGIEPRDFRLPANTTNSDLQKLLHELSADSAIDGILLQLPLPRGLDEFGALLAIDPEKDVDGLHPMSQGLLMRGATTYPGREGRAVPAHRPCTPKGCMILIDEARSQLSKPADLAGLKAVVIGRSVLVGKPIAQMLTERNCTVSLCHSRTKNLAAEAREADIVVAAIGRPEIIGPEYVGNGAIVIDVGINRLEDGRIVGDVAYAPVAEKAAAITPVPGGVGPMTIAVLLENTAIAASFKAGLPW